jgi:choline dehydrogenase-like flavoprotein
MTDDRRAVVIGSGPSGASAALMLLQRGIPVTMLESGRAFQPGLVVRAFGRNLFRKWTTNDDQYAYVASGDPDTAWCNTLTPGGLSNYWTGAVPRFAPDDFFEGSRLHERYRWPISYAELAPYYTLAERLLGVVGERRAVPQLSAPEALIHERRLPRAWQRIAAKAEHSGQGLVYSPLADGPSWLIRPTGAAFNSFERIVGRLCQDPHFELRLGAHAQLLTWNRALGRVDGVEYVNRTTGTPHHIRAASVVVAAGPLASPKLLLQSVSSEFPDGLGNSYGLVGRYLHDHPKDWCILELDDPLPRLDQPLYLSRAPYADSAPLVAASLTFGPLAKWDRLVSFTGARTARFGLVTFATMRPEAHNYIALHPEQRDRFGMPVLDIHMRYGEEVTQAVSETHARLRAIFASAGYRIGIACSLDRLVPGWSAHYGGGARMHASPAFGVVDRWNRLHDVDNVAVVDASSFTTAVEKNPTLTVMALAARAADRLADDLRYDRLGPAIRLTHALPPLR